MAMSLRRIFNCTSLCNLSTSHLVPGSLYSESRHVKFQMLSSLNRTCRTYVNFIKPRASAASAHKGQNKKQNKGRTFKASKELSEHLRHQILGNFHFTDTVIFSRRAWISGSKSDDTLLKIDKDVTKGKERQAIAQLSISDIETLLTASVHSPRSFLKYRAIFHLIEHELIRRRLMLQKKTLLYVADAFYVLNYPANLYLRMLLRLFDTRWENLELPLEEIVQLLFYIGILRDAPRPLMIKMEESLLKRVQSISGTQLGLICHAFFSTNAAITNMELLEKFSDILLRDVADMPISQVANVLKVFRHASFSNSKFYEGLGNQLSDRNLLSGDFVFSSIAHICTTYASLKVAHDKWFDKVGTLLSKVTAAQQDGTVYLRLKDMMRLGWSFANLQYDLPDSFLKKMVELLDKEARSYPESFVECLNMLAMCGEYPQEHISYALSPSFWNLKKGRLLKQVEQLALIDTAVSIDRPEYSGCRLSEEQRSSCMTDSNVLGLELHRRQGLACLLLTLRELFGDSRMIKCHFVLPIAKVADLEIQLDDQNRPQPVFDVDSEQEIILKKFEEAFTAEGMPSRLSIIETMLSENPEIMNFPRTHENIFYPPTPTGQQNKASASTRRIVIKVLSWNQYLTNKPILVGHHQMETRLLARSGYEVLNINPRQAQYLDNLSKAERTALAVEEIIKPLNIQL